MTEQELRALVRDAVARHLGRPAAPACASPAPSHIFQQAPLERADSNVAHASHALYLQLVNVSDTCLIEPAVTCSHCGYCQSHGH